MTAISPAITVRVRGHAKVLEPYSLTADDADGCHRVQCPAAAGKVRCPLRPASVGFRRVSRSAKPRGAFACLH